MLRGFAQRCKRAVMNCRDAALPIRSYAQHGEDVIIGRALHGVDPQSAIYVDVGANQPTRLSNTYRLYRLGYSGIAVEPDPSLAPLWRAIRPRDLLVIAACGSAACVKQFGLAKASVNSGFGLDDSQVVRRFATPVLTLDQVAEVRPGLPIALLSLDVEGYEPEILDGAAQTLARTCIALIEDNGNVMKIGERLTPFGLELSGRAGCNTLFVNRARLNSLARAR